MAITATLKTDRTHAVHFVVRGDQRFPLDMLRRDACTFTVEQDAHTAEESIEGTYTDQHFYALVSYRRWPEWTPSTARWLALGYEVVELSITSDPRFPSTLSPR